MAKKKGRKRGRKRGLTPLQERFCREYVIDLVATAAAVRAGYAAKDASRQGCILLKKPHVRALIEKLQTKQHQKLELKAENVLLELSRIGFVDPGALFDGGGAMLPIHEIPEDIRRAISSVEVKPILARRGKTKVEIGRALKIRFWSKVEALETLGKHFKLWIDRLELSGRIDVAEALKKARERRLKGLPSHAAATTPVETEPGGTAP